MLCKHVYSCDGYTDIAVARARGNGTGNGNFAEGNVVPGMTRDIMAARGLLAPLLMPP